MKRPGRILVVDDAERWRTTLSEILEQGDYRTDTAATVAEAKRCLSQHLYHLIVLDIRMEDTDESNTEGMTMLDYLKATYPGESIRIIMLSAFGTKEQMRIAFRDHTIDDFMSKLDFDDRVFLEQVNTIFANKVKANLNLAIHWQAASGPEHVVVGLDIGEHRIKRTESERVASIGVELDDLLCRLFCHAETLLVGPLTPGHSGAAVLRAQPFYPTGGARPVIVKFGEAGKIAAEYHNFEEHVKEFIGGGRSTTVHDVRYTLHLGGIAYSLLDAREDGIQDFGGFYRHATTSQIIEVLDRLFFHTCGAWYANTGNLKAIDLTAQYIDLLGLKREKLELAISEQLKGVEGRHKLYFRGLAEKRPFTNPLVAMDHAFVRPTYSCVTHGDFNQHNILVDANYQTWLIDFLSTGQAHRLRDVATLDTVIRIQLLQAEEATLEERLQMEERLARVVLFSQLEQLGDEIPTSNPAIAKAYTISLHLRGIARRLVMHNPQQDMSEYHIAALYLALNTLRFYGLSAVQREQALLSAALLAEHLGL